MGKLIIEYFPESAKHKGGRIESMKCKSEERAKQIVAKRGNIKCWNFYESTTSVPAWQKPKEPKEVSPFDFKNFDEFEAARKAGII